MQAASFDCAVDACRLPVLTVLSMHEFAWYILYFPGGDFFPVVLIKLLLFRGSWRFFSRLFKASLWCCPADPLASGVALLFELAGSVVRCSS